MLLRQSHTLHEQEEVERPPARPVDYLHAVWHLGWGGRCVRVVDLETSSAKTVGGFPKCVRLIRATALATPTACDEERPRKKQRLPAHQGRESNPAYDGLRMKVFAKFAARRRRKAHERYLREREWQRMLAEKDTAKTVRDVATNWGVAGQATSGPGQGL